MAHKKEILARALDVTGCGSLLRRIGPWRGLLVLNYHRIGNPAESPLDSGVFSASTDQFDRQLAWLKHNADVVHLRDLDRALSSRGRYVLITFDDGYADNHQLALPLLQKHSLPAAFFITTGFIDDRRIAWWDEIAWMVANATHHQLPARVGEPIAADTRDQATRHLLKTFKELPTDETPKFLDEIAQSTGSGRWIGTDPWMTWDMVRDLHNAGHAIGAHTVTHPLLARSTPERQRDELQNSKARLETQLNTTVDAFSYPVGIPGSYSDDTIRLVQEAGFRWAFSFQGGFASTGRPTSTDPFRLPRVAMETGLSGPRFRALNTLPQLFA
jgi:peptidoglycan/xylan/chitin deacetylase (PgdA/CDA1 family)